MTKGFRIPGSAEAHDIAEKRLCAEISKRFKGRCFLLHQYVGMFSSCSRSVGIPRYGMFGSMPETRSVYGLSLIHI